MSAYKKGKFKTVDIVYIAVFTAIIVICAWISIPTPVPFTMQTFGIFLTIKVLGGKRGTISIFIYLMLGLVGMPVFSGFNGGISSIFGPTGGYIIGFLLAALLMWAGESLQKKECRFEILFTIAAMVVCYAFGTVWFIIFYTNTNGSVSVLTAFTWCVLPYIIPDAIKIFFAYAVSAKIGKFYKI